MFGVRHAAENTRARLDKLDSIGKKSARGARVTLCGRWQQLTAGKIRIGTDTGSRKCQSNGYFSPQTRFLGGHCEFGHNLLDIGYAESGGRNFRAGRVSMALMVRARRPIRQPASVSR
jgi:hypothetical protein